MALAFQLRFLGTRANVEQRTWRHRRHSALLVTTRQGRLMVDCGSDWRGLIGAIAPDAILLTHAHPDHAWGLADGAPCPVYATKESWDRLSHFPVTDAREVMPGGEFALAGATIRAVAVTHSLRAPAVGYRISGEAASFFYVPDVVAITERAAALRGVSLYVGDGSTLGNSLVRRRGDELFGHTTISAQLGWCAAEGVARALFTHCGGPLIDDDRACRRAVRELGRARGVGATLAFDGLRLDLPHSSTPGLHSSSSAVRMR